MTIRFASALLALALPICAQDPAASQVENVFYKAYYLEKGQRDFAGAMTLYEQFLEKAPEHKLAQEAALLHFRLLDRTGKTKERDAFREKYAKLLGNVADAPARAERSEEAEDAGDRPARGERGQRGQRGGQRGGLFGMLRGDTKVADMSEEQLKELKDGIEQSSQMIERFREARPEMAEKMETAIGNLKKALDANKLDDAQKAIDALREAFPQRRRGGGGEGDAGGRGGNRRGGGGGGGGGGN